MKTIEEPREIAEKIAGQCNQCRRKLLLEVGAGCPPIRVEAWLKIVVCNRCGEYLEKYRRIDDAIAFVCNRWAMAGRNRDAARAQIAGQLEALTRELVRVLTLRYDTTADWSMQFVEVLMECPDRSRIAVRLEEKSHRKARSEADRQMMLNSGGDER